MWSPGIHFSISSEYFPTFQCFQNNYRIQYSNVYLTCFLSGSKVSSIWLLTCFLFIYWWVVLRSWLQCDNLRSDLVIHHKLQILELLHQDSPSFLPVKAKLQYSLRLLTLTWPLLWNYVYHKSEYFSISAFNSATCTSFMKSIFFVCLKVYQIMSYSRIVSVE